MRDASAKNAARSQSNRANPGGAMAKQNQTEQNRTTKTSAGGSTTTSESARPTSERQKNIETSQDRSGQRSSMSRPLSGSVETGSRPFTLMRRLSDDLDQLFDQFGFGRFGLGVQPAGRSLFDDDLWSLSRGSSVATWSPQIETFQRGDKIIVRADLPGLNKDNVNVEVNDGILTISGERKDEQEENREGFYRSERSYGQFFRSIPLPEGVNEDQCEATFKDGVLEISFSAPKHEERKARKIPVR
jgi:HSP20 family protein